MLDMLDMLDLLDLLDLPGLDASYTVAAHRIPPPSPSPVWILAQRRRLAASRRGNAHAEPTRPVCPAVTTQPTTEFARSLQNTPFRGREWLAKLWSSSLRPSSCLLRSSARETLRPDFGRMGVCPKGHVHELRCGCPEVGRVKTAGCLVSIQGC